MKQKIIKRLLSLILAAAVTAAASFILPYTVHAAFIRPVNICFLGNSYMYINDLRGKFSSICKGEGLSVSVTMYAWESAYLSDHAGSGEVLKDLAGGEYDIVVLQEESRIVWQDTATSRKYAKILADAAKKGGCSVYLYQTMSYRDDGPEDQVYYTDAYNSIAKYIGGTVCPCGERFWAYMAENDLTVDDMFEDWQHPSALGMQVVAQTMYDTMAEDLQSRASTFYDVPLSHSFHKAVYWAADQGIAAGYSGERTGYFGVNDDITRGQVVTFLWRAAGRPEPVSNTKTFSDVSVSSNFYKAIQWAVEQGITAGYTGSRSGQFGPSDNCTRGQCVTFLYRMLSQ